MNTNTKHPSFTHAFVCITGTIAIIFSGLFIVHTKMQAMMVISVFWVLLNVLLLSFDMQRLKNSMTSAIQNSAAVLLIYIFIGAVIGAFIISGAIPTLIYYGLKLVTPQVFLPVGMILCSLTSLAIGSSWATIGTMGIALLGVATILHVPLPIAAGMIVSGAYFGDKLSPISDTTILSAMVTGTCLYKHIKGLTYSLLPAYFFSILLFWIIGIFYIPQEITDLKQLTEVLTYLDTHYQLGLIPILPMLVMFSIAASRKPAELSMLVGAILSLLVAYFCQHQTLQNTIDALYLGSTVKVGNMPIIENILNRGGIERMLSSVALTLLILALGGLLESYHFITVLFSAALKKLKSPTQLVGATLGTSIITNMLVSEAYLTIILVNKIYGKAFKAQNLDSCLLSKSIEEGATFSTPLIPWTTSGIFISTTLGVSASQYLPWSIFNFIAPLFFIIFVACQFFGRKMFVLPMRLQNA
ncbi:MAG: hypothetical protein A3F18_07150 [Legionellales bacterium RIFCSPHIGHO2_12_FULL_37_14]|nr:MAG: hypothetical protein A3F18_07150 [Legionellales bacterium RIFCSPHIGHO2_12_FULL_37_14]